VKSKYNDFTFQEIEQIFDITKTNATIIMPFKALRDEIIKGVILISFMARAVYSLISMGLVNFKNTANKAFFEMNYLQVYRFETGRMVVDELTVRKRDIFKNL
jgi:hypothetical protein